MQANKNNSSVTKKSKPASSAVQAKDKAILVPPTNKKPQKSAPAHDNMSDDGEEEPDVSTTIKSGGASEKKRKAVDTPTTGKSADIDKKPAKKKVKQASGTTAKQKDSETNKKEDVKKPKANIPAPGLKDHPFPFQLRETFEISRVADVLFKRHTNILVEVQGHLAKLSVHDLPKGVSISGLVGQRAVVAEIWHNSITKKHEFRVSCKPEDFNGTYHNSLISHLETNKIYDAVALPGEINQVIILGYMGKSLPIPDGDGLLQASAWGAAVKVRIDQDDSNGPRRYTLDKIVQKNDSKIVKPEKSEKPEKPEKPEKTRK